MELGFTGTRHLIDERKTVLHARLDELIKMGLTHAITGACVGVDAEVVWYLLKVAPEVQHTIVVPFNRKGIDGMLLSLKMVKFIFMPDGTSYKERDTKIVELSPAMEAFWTGQVIRSGTFMTINIAKRAGKPVHITRF